MKLLKKYGRLSVTNKIIKAKHGYNHKVVCLCSCGNEKAIYICNLRYGNTKSCGCLNAEKSGNRLRKHGQSSSHTYKGWVAMKARCQNPNNNRYYRYGARGIKVCDRWQKFENYLADMGERPMGLTIDRIDNDGNYEPTNCRWATYSEQRKNQTKYLLAHQF